MQSLFITGWAQVRMSHSLASRHSWLQVPMDIDPDSDVKDKPTIIAQVREQN